MTPNTPHIAQDWTPEQRRRAFWGLTFASSTGVVAYNALLGNLLPLFANRIGFTVVLIGTLYLTMQAPAFLQIFAARYADRHGGKRIALVGFMVSPLMLLPIVFSPQLGNWLGPWAAGAGVFFGAIGYTFCGVAVGAGWMPLLGANLERNKISELIGKINRVNMACGVAATCAFSLFLGEHPDLWRFQAIFLVGTLLAGIRGLKFGAVRDLEPNPQAGSEPLWADLGTVRADLPFRRVLIFTLLSFGATNIAGPFRPLYVHSLGFSERFAALVTVPLVLGSFGLTTAAWGALADRYGSRACYVIAGVLVTVGQLMMTIPTGHGAGDAVIVIAALFLMASAWGGIDGGNLRRLYTIVPKQRQAIYMTLYMITVGISAALGPFIGGLLVKTAQMASTGSWVTEGAPRALDYKIVFLVAAAVTTVGIGYTHRMMALKEISAPRLLLYMRIRVQRTLMNGLPGTILRKLFPEDED